MQRYNRAADEHDSAGEKCAGGKSHRGRSSDTSSANSMATPNAMVIFSATPTPPFFAIGFRTSRRSPLELSGRSRRDRLKAREISLTIARAMRLLTLQTFITELNFQFSARADARWDQRPQT
jgi:hypothetical protein